MKPKITLPMLALAGTALFGIAACQAPESTSAKNKQETSTSIHPERWPKQTSPLTRDPDMEARINDLLSRMSDEEKVGQVIQADIASVTPEQAKEYHLGSILNGGNSAPNNDNRTAAKNWLALADQFYQASTDTSAGGVNIPIMWGVDAVHGHNNIVGATLFPHNIGLGAANDPKMMKQIGEVTAKEIRVTGNDWTFAPTVAVARNDRWGRTFESYSENPDIVARYSAALVEGLQGQVNTPDFLSDEHVIATVKHFVGDGSTEGGIDQGNSTVSEAELRDIHAAGYPPAIRAGVQVAMASYNSWYGTKMHGYKAMLSDVLVDRMGFDGFVVGDWNGHGQVEGCKPTSCAQAFNAGLDMFMAPDSWQELYANTLEQVKNGVISQARLDEAVGRILRVKLRAGLFDAGLPSQRPFAGEYQQLGAPEHRALAREAVRKSLVLLKNNQQLLPLRSDQRVLVAGSAADSIGQAAGGWTLSWQGTGNENQHFPNGQSIYAGIEEQVTSHGGTVTFSEQGNFDVKPDVAIVVFGERPYAEFQGDIASVDFADNEGLNILTALHAQGIPTVSVFLSGRPLWVNPELNKSTAFVAAWLPGTEGGGVADLLFADENGEPQYNFTGRLSFSWPSSPAQEELNKGDKDYDPLFELGYGLSLSDNTTVPRLNEKVASSAAMDHLTRYIYAGDAVVPWKMLLEDEQGTEEVDGPRVSGPADTLTVEATDFQAQEDTIRATWTGPASLSIQGKPVDISRQANGDMALALTYQVLQSDNTPTQLSMGCGTDCEGIIDISKQVQQYQGQGWKTSAIKLSCFSQRGADMMKIDSPLTITAEEGLRLQILKAELVSNQGQASCSL